MAGKIERKPFDKPDETRAFKNGKGKLEVVTVGEHTFGRGIFEPGWRWSEHVKPIAGTRLAKRRTPAMSLRDAWL